ncbi:MerR family transcriptional regulator [Streptosporangium sp. NPDC006007]|uniref:helix-turn-helix domain-containing protein n=1 Tax=Streptosporangium sp. NPDC006007 TaxID=3154575 RepID=UPI0033B4BF2B
MEWTIGELAERASAALSPTAQLNGRVRDAPNERLIRWYATIGLLDPPSARRGRVAVYGRRHLLQLIAVKRRQSEGRTIAEIQAELAGATDRLLESIADLQELPPEGAGVPERSTAKEGGGGPRRAAPRAARPRFWADPLTAAETGLTTALPGAPASQSAAPGGRGGSGAVVVHGVRLAAGVTLLLDGGRPPSSAELAEIGAASEALLSVLRQHDLAPHEGNRS